MLERLDAAFTSQKRFVANAAHELRTPLTAMRTAIEVTLSKPTRTPDQLEAMAARVKRSVERAEATVEALLTLATSELGPTAQEAIDLATAAEDALDATHAAIDQRQITVDATLEPALARGDRVLLERMIANLVENAVRHNNPGGWIGIRTIQHADSAGVRDRQHGTERPRRADPDPVRALRPRHSNVSTPPTASGSASRSPTRSPAPTTPRSPPARGPAVGSNCRSRSRAARADGAPEPRQSLRGRFAAQAAARGEMLRCRNRRQAATCADWPGPGDCSRTRRKLSPARRCLSIAAILEAAQPPCSGSISRGRRVAGTLWACGRREQREVTGSGGGGLGASLQDVRQQGGMLEHWEVSPRKLDRVDAEQP